MMRKLERASRRCPYRSGRGLARGVCSSLDHADLPTTIRSSHLRLAHRIYSRRRWDGERAAVPGGGGIIPRLRRQAEGTHSRLDGRVAAAQDHGDGGAGQRVLYELGLARRAVLAVLGAQVHAIADAVEGLGPPGRHLQLGRIRIMY